MEQESDAERMKHAPARAFEWVLPELVIPTGTAQMLLREAFFASIWEGSRKGTRMLEKAWPDGARWPSGEAYIRTLGWRAPDEFSDDEAADTYADEYSGPELMELLHHRLVHVAHRMYRDAQVSRVLKHGKPYTHARLNRDGEVWGDCCGLGIDKIIDIQEALRLLEHPAHAHPACRCTIDPFPV